jgi:hypothetical protein
VKLPIEIQYFPSHFSLTPELVGLLVRSSSAVLEGSEHSDYYFMRSWVVLLTWIVGVGV